MFNISLDIAEENISELDERLIEISKLNHENRKKKIHKSIKDKRAVVKSCGRSRRTRVGREWGNMIFEGMIAKNF